MLEPKQIRVELMTRYESGPDPAGDRTQFVVANQRANVLLRAAELGGNLTDRQWCGPLHARSIAWSTTSAQNQEVEPVASRLVRRVAYSAAETFLPTEELVLGESAHRRVGRAKAVQLAEEAGEARGVGLANRLESLLIESCRRERMHVSVTDGYASTARAVSGNQRTSSTLFNLPGKP